eukprot:TRINITY_DN5361_c0_g1_i1.p1 TRINITY_DN5361_c0_g1~~TRINITY_DN5361_c0_g1_i1.p1  ORF type:complete len:365 (+),score=89.10 TRINITY_DN5361_c0_g1_i1:31-1095(+)
MAHKATSDDGRSHDPKHAKGAPNDEVQAALREICAAYDRSDKKAIKLKHSIADDYKLLDEIVSDAAKQQKELGNFDKLVKSKSASLSEEDRKNLAHVRSGLNTLKQQYAPETGSIFVRLFLGKVNVKQYRDGERLRLKQEYETFKSKTNPQFIGFVVLMYFLPHPMLITIWQIWLLYYYITLALRENILRVNGSSIKRWWIVHHYLSMSGALVMLLWPLGPSYVHFFPQVLRFSFAQGLVQVLINRYQQGQLYKLVAMGKATIMDVAGESEGWIDDPGWTPSAMFLLPFLLTVQLLQLYTAGSFFLYAVTHDLFSQWQVTLCGIIFAILGCGNLYTTLRTYAHKFMHTGKTKHS